MSFLTAETDKHRDSVRRRPSTTVDGRDGGISSPKLRRSAKAKAAWVRVVEDLRLAARDQEWIGKPERQKTPKTSGRANRRIGELRASFIDDSSVNQHEEHDLRIFILVERTDEKSVLLAWHSSTQGRVTDQPWSRSRAEETARCAMSGQTVKSGDLVYSMPLYTSPLTSIRAVQVTEQGGGC